MKALLLMLPLMFVIIAQPVLAQPCFNGDVVGGNLSGNDTININRSTSTYGTLGSIIWLDSDRGNITNYRTICANNLTINLFNYSDILIETNKTNITGDYIFLIIWSETHIVDIISSPRIIGDLAWYLNDNCTKNTTMISKDTTRMYNYTISINHSKSNGSIDFGFLRSCYNIDSNPRGARISVDGIDYGKTPNREVRCEPAPNNVELIFDVPDETHNVPLSKFAPFSKFHIESNPPGAEIFIDGEYYGKTPKDDVRCEPGHDNIVISFGRLRPDIKDIFVTLTLCD